jgi:hypothetical protein
MRCEAKVGYVYRNFIYPIWSSWTYAYTASRFRGVARRISSTLRDDLE